MLTRHSEADHVVEVNKAGVEIARHAFGEKEGYVLGDIGPFGGLLQPFGEFTEAQVQSAFEEQAAALVEGCLLYTSSGRPAHSRAQRKASSPSPQESPGATLSPGRWPRRRYTSIRRNSSPDQLARSVWHLSLIHI